MKRLICAILTACIALCLASCGEPPAVADSFEADFSAEGGAIRASGRLSLTNGALSISFAEPDTVRDMSFDYSDGGLVISEGGLSAGAGCDYIPAAAIPSVLHNTLAYLSEAAYTGTEDGLDSFILTAPTGEAVITARNGMPESLTDTYSDLEFTFTNVRLRTEADSAGE